MTKRLTPSENARRAIELEEIVRQTWPRSGTELFDRRAEALARRLRNTSNDRKARVFAALDVQRQKYEPTAAELYRLGLEIEDAIARVNRRAREYQQLCARLWSWRVSERDRYVN